jgi:hypothetical protein
MSRITDLRDTLLLFFHHWNEIEGGTMIGESGKQKTVQEKFLYKLEMVPQRHHLIFPFLCLSLFRIPTYI